MNRAEFDRVCAEWKMSPRPGGLSWEWPDGTAARMDVGDVHAYVTHPDRRESVALRTVTGLRDYLQHEKLLQANKATDKTEHESETIDVHFVEWCDVNNRYGIGRLHPRGVALTLHAGDLTTGLDQCITHVLSEDQVATLAAALTSMARKVGG